MLPLTRLRKRTRFFGVSGPSFALDFVNGGALDPRITFTRASSATYFDDAGTLQSAAINVPRRDYDPATLLPRGLLIEGQRTNSIRNNTMQGAVAGTPGTLPTNWIAPVAPAGLNREIVGFGTELGIAYIDIRYSGTTTSTSSTVIQPEGPTSVVAATGQSWTASSWLALAGGSTSGLSGVIQRVTGRSITGSLLELTDTGVILTSSLARYTASRAMIIASTERVTSDIILSYPLGAAIDITLRIGLPQLEQGAFATSVIPTTTTALTRAADVAAVNTLSPWYNATEGTLYAEGVSRVTGNAALASLDDGGSNNTINIAATNTTGSAFFGITTLGVGQLTGGSVSGATVPLKAAIAYKTNDTAWTLLGGVAITDTSVSLPTVNRLQLGIRGGGAIPLSGWLRRITYYPRRLSDTELQALTTP